MVQRYDFYSGVGYMERSDIGDYIKFTDVIEALKKCEKQGAYQTMIFLSDAIKAIEETANDRTK